MKIHHNQDLIKEGLEKEEFFISPGHHHHHHCRTHVLCMTSLYRTCRRLRGKTFFIAALAKLMWTFLMFDAIYFHFLSPPPSPAHGQSS